MWQGSQNLRATQKESRSQNTQMTDVQYNSDMEENAKALWSVSQPNGEVAFTIAERSPLSPTLFAKDIPGGRTQILNIRQI